MVQVRRHRIVLANTSAVGSESWAHGRRCPRPGRSVRGKPPTKTAHTFGPADSATPTSPNPNRPRSPGGPSTSVHVDRHVFDAVDQVRNQALRRPVSWMRWRQGRSSSNVTLTCTRPNGRFLRRSLRATRWAHGAGATGMPREARSRHRAPPVTVLAHQSSPSILAHHGRCVRRHESNRLEPNDQPQSSSAHGRFSLETAGWIVIGSDNDPPGRRNRSMETPAGHASRRWRGAARTGR